MAETFEQNAAAEEHPNYITVTQGMRGYYSVLMKWDDELEFYEPFVTSDFSWKTFAKAKADAEFWAQAEGLELR